MRFRQFLEAIAWQQVMDKVPANLAASLEQIPEDLLQQIVTAIAEDAETTRQPIENLWMQYIKAKTPADIYKIRTANNQMGQANRVARTLNPEDQQKHQIYNAYYQKLESLFQNAPQSPLPRDVLNIFKLNPDFATTLIAPSFWQLKQKGETVQPFYNNKNVVTIAPDFPYNKYREWINVLNSAIQRTPLNTLKAMMQTRV